MKDFFPPFTPSTAFPQLCSGATLKYDSRRGLYISANRDMPCGEVVCLDTGKVVNLDSRLCCYCLRMLPENHNSRHCECCTETEKLYGPFEQPFANELQNLGMFRLAVHLALSYTAEEIEACLRKGELHREKLDLTAMSSDTLAAVLSLQIDPFPVDITPTEDLVKAIVKRLDKHPYWQYIPSSRRLEAFKTLLGLISRRLMTNAHSVYFVDKLESRSETNLENSIPSGVGLFAAASWFNHSCRANLNSFFYENKLIFVSMGIREGEEVCDNYGVSFFKHTVEERKNFLAGRGFTCECCTCVARDWMDDKLESFVGDPALILKSLVRAENITQCRSILSDGHRSIEAIAEMCGGAICENDPKQRLFLYGEILDCQRCRGLHFTPDQIRIHLSCVLASYELWTRSEGNKRKHMLTMKTHLFASLVRMRTFYGNLYPAYDASKALAEELIRLDESEMLGSFEVLFEDLRSALKPLTPIFAKS